MGKTFTNKKMEPMLRHIDLFAGTGAFSLAFQKTGRVQTVYANDIEKASQKIYEENFDDELILKDLTTVDITDIPSHDILTGGFPCQPFSIAGNQEGFDDSRSNVFWKILEIVRHHQPQIVLLENVKNLVSHDKGNTFRIITTHLEQLGYHIKFQVLNTSVITGIPQHRERIYIACFQDRQVFKKFDFKFDPKHKRKISELLEDEDSIGTPFYYNESSAIWPILSQHVKKPDTLYQYRRYYVRENKSQECPTLTANMGTGGHNVPIIFGRRGIRKLTPRECFNFQGFPSSYRLPKKMSNASLYKLAGNAVSVPVVELIAERIVNLL